MKYKVVIFDLDNTLINFDLMEAGSFNESLKALGIVVTDEMFETYKAINQGLWQKLEDKTMTKAEILVKRFQILFETYKIHACPEVCNQKYLANMSNHLYMIEGAYDLLEALKSRVKIVCLTNGVLEAQEAKLDKAALGPYFDHIVISDQVGFHKPDVKIFEYMHERLQGYDKSDMVIIGDSLTSDIQGGINYGISTVWFNHRKVTYEGPRIFDEEITDLKALKNILF